MRHAARFLIALLIGLAALTLAGHFILSRTTQSWFASDVVLRSQLAVTSARQSLVAAWPSKPEALAEALADITRDERIMAAAACSLDGNLLASTPGYPGSFSCGSLVPRKFAEQSEGYSQLVELPTGTAQLSVVPLVSSAQVIGAIVLAHDLSFVERREATTRKLMLAAFFILGLGASIITYLAARFAWRGWTSELREALAGNGKREFLPLVRDVRALVDRLAEERESEGQTGPWSPARLRATLLRYLQGERVVVLANREPYIHEATPTGVRVQHPASGLVTALEPVLRACSGVWVAHGSGSADREVVDGSDRVWVPPEEKSYQLRRVWLTDAEEAGYYYGFSNEGLWPLCHVAHARPVFRAQDYDQYVRVNQKFADAVCSEVDTDDPIVLVQDYHFALAPRMIRERLPQATILSFWHIPWPNAERIGICPWREELISGLLGSSIVGFQTQQHCNNFIDSVDAFMESRIDRETTAVIQGSRRTLIRPYPISIEWPVHWLTGLPSVAECRAEVRRELGLGETALLGVGIDRLDYTKGIEERLLAVDELLEHHPEFRGRFTFAQLAAPSRTKIGRYQELNDQIEALTQRINRKWSSADYRPIVLLRRHHEPSTVFRYYRAAELCYVSSLHDGMNLVAKEFVAARDDERGVLVLSQFTGAARDLTEALIVNPYDLRQAGGALAAALHMSGAEQKERMRSMRRLIAEFNVYRWAGRMLVDASELRRKERLTGRLSTSGILSSGIRAA
jgi:trehalose 6-phosphate synthase